MISARSKEIIEKSQVNPRKPVRLIMFTSDTGCASCPEMLALAQTIKAQAGTIAFEHYDFVMDRDKSQQYGITRVPALVVEDREGKSVTFSGRIEGLFLNVLLNTITAVGDSKIWFPEDIRRTLKHLENSVAIRVLVEPDCPLCLPVAEAAIGLAFENPLIETDIIIAKEYPELMKKYGVTMLPKTIFGENLHMDGHVTEGDFLEMIYQAEGVRPGPDRKCIVCAKQSPEIICPQCKTRIQAEAFEHKLKSEKIKQPEML